VGSDSRLSFWHDKWLIEGELRSLILGPLLRDEDKLRISDMVHKGRWNVNLCSFVFPPRSFSASELFLPPKQLISRIPSARGYHPQESLKGNLPIACERE